MNERDENGLDAIRSVLMRHGEVFHGGRPDDIAADWLDHGFDAYSVDDWCVVGCWDASTAEQFGLAGLDPSRAHKACQVCFSHPAAKQDAMYAACNGDMLVSVIVAEYNAFRK